jgi:hypothetical protein
LLPDPHDGNDWLETVVAFQSVAPNLYKFDAETCAEQIHFWTAGAKRRLGQLLLIAAGLACVAKKPVVLKTIEKAYKSPAYTANREDIGFLYQQATSGCPAKKTRKDLYSPFPLSESESQQLASSAQAADESAVTQDYLGSTMTPEEKRRLGEIQKARAENAGTKATVTPIRLSLSKMEALKAGDEQFRNEE